MASAESFYKPELDVLRFCAFGMVFCFHISEIFPHKLMWLSRAGDAGVQVFFVLSSFLIGSLLLREREATGEVQLERFYLRRILRIWPVYFLILLGGFALSTVSGDRSFTPHALAAFTFLGGNLYIAANGWPMSDIIAVLWTISVEEQFYALAPFVWSRGSRRAVAIFSAAVIGLAYLTLLIHFFGRGDDQHVWYSSAVQFQYFGFGMLLAILLHGRQVRLRGWARAALLLVAAACFVSSQSLFRFRTFPAGWHTCAGYLVLGVGACCMLVGFLGWQRIGRCRRLIYLGRISYGLYAYHLLAKAIVVGVSRPVEARVMALPHGYWIFAYPFFAGTLAVTIGLAALSYRFVETPFLRLKDRVGTVRQRRLATA